VRPAHQVLGLALWCCALAPWFALLLSTCVAHEAFLLRKASRCWRVMIRLRPILR